MAPRPPLEPGLPRDGRVAHLALALLILAQIGRVLADEDAQAELPAYGALMAVYVALFGLTQWRGGLTGWRSHAYLGLQSTLVLLMLSLNPEADTVTAFFVPLSFQAALCLSGRALWGWVVVMAALTGGSLMGMRGPLEGLALAMSPMAAIVALPALIVANHRVETERRVSQLLLAELELRRTRLQQHADEVEELAAIHERHRLARSLHDTASQIVFSIVLTARSAQLLLKQDPRRTREQLLRLQEMSGTALLQLRSLITQLRP
jgi:signal transduction histidine kinase